MSERPVDSDPEETREWIEALESAIEREGAQRAHFLIEALVDRARRARIHLPYRATTAYVNSVDVQEEAKIPFDQHLFLRNPIASNQQVANPKNRRNKIEETKTKKKKRRKKI